MTTTAVQSSEEIPYFFLIDEKRYVIGTPRGIGKSEKTMDIPFHDLAKSYDLQVKLKLLSAVLIRPCYNPPLAYPLEGKELISCAATFLAAFAEDDQEKKQRRDYLINNGLVRILFTDDNLRQEIVSLQSMQSKP